MKVIIFPNIWDRNLPDYSTVSVESIRVKLVEGIDSIDMDITYLDLHFADILIALQILDLQQIGPQIIREATIVRLGVFKFDGPLGWIGVLVDHDTYSNTTARVKLIVSSSHISTVAFPTRLIVIVDVFSPTDITHELV